MSTLEKIRKRPGLVITIVGFAIVLFIVTGVITSFDIFSDHETAVKVDGEKIKYNDLAARTQQAYDQQRERYRSQGMNPEQVNYQNVQQQTLNQLITETLLNKSIDRLGITVTDQELSQLLFGEVPNPDVQYMVQAANQLDPTIVDAKGLYRFIKSNRPEAAQFKEMWHNIENQLRDELVKSKYSAQLQALTANKLDAQSYYNDNSRTATVAVVRQDFMALPDADFEPTDAEIKDYYNNTKEEYSIPAEKRFVEYILVTPQPSADDYAAAQQEVSQALIDLANNPGTDGVSGNYSFAVDTYKGSEAAIPDPVIKRNLAKLEADSSKVQMLEYNNGTKTYTIGKLLDVYSAPDTAYIDIVGVASADADSIVNLLNAGSDVASLGDKVISSNLDFAMPIIGSEFEMYKEQYDANGTGKYFTLNIPGAEGQPNALVTRAIRYTAPVKIYNVARITRKVVPSSTTLNNLDEQLRGYIAEHPTAKQFKDSAQTADYLTRSALVDASMLTFPDPAAPSSAAAARWVMENDKGDVSGVFTDSERSYMLAIAINDIYNNGYITTSYPYVNDRIVSKVRNQKKGEKLMGDYKGKASDIAGYANLMNAAIDTIANVSFGRDVRNAVNSPAFSANFANAKKGDVVGPIATDNGVVVFQIVEESTNPREFDFEQDAQAFNQNMGVNRLNFDAILRGNKDIDYTVQRFMGAE